MKEKFFVCHVLKESLHEETDFCESSAMETKRSSFQKIAGMFWDIFIALTCLRFSIAAVIMMTRG